MKEPSSPRENVDPNDRVMARMVTENIPNAVEGSFIVYEESLVLKMYCDASKPPPTHGLPPGFKWHYIMGIWSMVPKIFADNFDYLNSSPEEDDPLQGDYDVDDDHVEETPGDASLELKDQLPRDSHDKMLEDKPIENGLETACVAVNLTD